MAAPKIKTLDVLSKSFALQGETENWGFPLDCMALYWEWSLSLEYVSASPIHFDIVVFTWSVGVTYLVSGFLSDGIARAKVYIKVPIGRGKSEAFCAIILVPKHSLSFLFVCCINFWSFPSLPFSNQMMSITSVKQTKGFEIWKAKPSVKSRAWKSLMSQSKVLPSHD